VVAVVEPDVAGHLLAPGLARHGDVHRAVVVWREGEPVVGRGPEIIVPLTVAVAGDFVKWGTPALAQPALQPVLATALGTGWQARVIEARAQHARILARSLLIGASGDYYAFDRETSRFHRLTRTGGAVPDDE
jgi:hypothetical protein